MKLKVILRRDEQEGGFVAKCPALPGCVSEGETKEQALENIREAIEDVLLTLNECAQRMAPTATLFEVEI